MKMTGKEEFRKVLTKVLQQAASAAGIKSYDSMIIDDLQRLAQTNGVTEIKNIHFKKASTKLDGYGVIAASVARIVKTAAEKAANENRTNLTREDMAHSFSVNFCTLYPIKMLM